MLLHSIIEDSTVNGPGHRVVVWFQGCRNMGGEGKGCKGCWNPDTHMFDRSKEIDAHFVAGQIVGILFQNKNITGVTFSGGEPLQDAANLRILCERIRQFSSSTSLGLFTGYSLEEMSVPFKYGYIGTEQQQDLQNARFEWPFIKEYLDWAAMGRYVESKQSNDESLIGSYNQKLHLFTNRYTLADFPPQQMEVTISDCLIQITGFPPENYLEDREV